MKMYIFRRWVAVFWTVFNILFSYTCMLCVFAVMSANFDADAICILIVGVNTNKVRQYQLIAFLISLILSTKIQASG